MAQKTAKPETQRSARAGGNTKASRKTKDASGTAASHLTAERANPTGDWRAQTLAEIRRLIREADPEIVEERKWIKPTNPAGVPTWSRAGIVCTGETYKAAVKVTFARGASLLDPHRLFNASLEGNVRRAIDLREGDSLDPEAFKALVRAAVAENLRSSVAKSKPAPNLAAKTNPSAAPKKVKLLSGGNPQIAKADGDAPVQAYIAALSGWKHDLAARLDSLIARTVPGVRRAVKWNSPFYGLEGNGWFLGIHTFNRYLKLTFFKGTSLRPLPPGGTPKSGETRWIDLHETDPLDEPQFTSWLKQAAALPGWIP